MTLTSIRYLKKASGSSENLYPADCESGAFLNTHQEVTF